MRNACDISQSLESKDKPYKSILRNSRVDRSINISVTSSQKDLTQSWKRIQFADEISIQECESFDSSIVLKGDVKSVL